MLAYDYEKRMEIRNSLDFKKSNYAWNKHCFNSRRCVGSLMTMIEKAKPKSLEDWEKYYFSHLPTNEVFNNVYTPFAKILGISKQLAFNYTYIRVIDETWIGYSKERKAVMALRNFAVRCDEHGYHGMRFRETSEKFDFNYSVDVEQYVNGKLVAGLQLKSRSYYYNHELRNSTSHRHNVEKQRHYSKRFNVPVYYVYYEDLNEQDVKLFNVLFQPVNPNKGKISVSF